MKFNPKIVGAVLIIIAVLIFILVPQKYYAPYFSAALIGIALYVLFVQEEIVKVFTDSKKLLNYQRRQPSGKLLPDWKSIPKKDKQIENYKDFFIYIWFDRTIAKKRAFVLNRIVKFDTVVQSKVFSLNVNQLATSDWRKIVIDEAFGKQEKKSEREMVEELRGKGYRVEYKSKNDEDDEEDD